MAIAFSGLLFSEIPALNQCALYLVVAVLFDTFVVRTLVVTAITGLVSDWNWWPSKMPLLDHIHASRADAVETVSNAILPELVVDQSDDVVDLLPIDDDDDDDE